MDPPVKFLLVDDTEDNLRELEAPLRQPGLELLKARSGPEALQLLREHDVALAIIDVQMPDMDGFQLAELMRAAERTRRIPIMFVTALGPDQQQRQFRGYEAGAVGFLFRPIDTHILHSKANAFFELHRQKQELARQRDELMAAAQEKTRLLEESRKVQDALRESERQWRILADAMPQLVWTTRPDGFHDFFNRRWYEYTGLSERESRERGCCAAIHPDDQHSAHALWRQSLATGCPYEAEYRCRRFDGQWRWFLARAYPLRNESGQIARWFGTSTEIHHQKMLMEFEQQLVGIVSHDLRNPLNAIIVGAEMLKRRGEMDQRTASVVDRICNSAGRAVRLVHDLLDLTKVRLGGGIPLNCRPVDFHSVVKSAVEELQDPDARRTISLEQSGAAEGEWDPDRLSQVVSNLLSNALTYGEPGTPVSVKSHGGEHTVTLRVHNLGAPIPPERLAHLFEPFHRGVSQGDMSRRSIGFGLYIAQHVVQAHGGHIAVESTADSGTLLTVTLPLRAQQRMGQA